MSLFSSLGSMVSAALDFNKATLSGALDIIAVQHDDGSIKSTPFHVRFGKFKLFRSRDRLVRVLVNGRETDLVMQLGDAGEAYFYTPNVDPTPLMAAAAASVPARGTDSSAATTVGSGVLAAASPADGLSSGTEPLDSLSRRSSLSLGEAALAAPPPSSAAPHPNTAPGVRSMRPTGDVSSLPQLQVDGTVTIDGVPVGTAAEWEATHAGPGDAAAAAARGHRKGSSASRAALEILRSEQHHLSGVFPAQLFPAQLPSVVADPTGAPVLPWTENGAATTADPLAGSHTTRKAPVRSDRGGRRRARRPLASSDTDAVLFLRSWNRHNGMGLLPSPRVHRSLAIAKCRAASPHEHDPSALLQVTNHPAVCFQPPPLLESMLLAGGGSTGSGAVVIAHPSLASSSSRVASIAAGPSEHIATLSTPGAGSTTPGTGSGPTSSRQILHPARRRRSLNTLRDAAGGWSAALRLGEVPGGGPVQAVGSPASTLPPLPQQQQQEQQHAFVAADTGVTPQSCASESSSRREAQRGLSGSFLEFVRSKRALGAPAAQDDISRGFVSGSASSSSSLHAGALLEEPHGGVAARGAVTAARRPSESGGLGRRRGFPPPAPQPALQERLALGAIPQPSPFPASRGAASPRCGRSVARTHATTTDEEGEGGGGNSSCRSVESAAFGDALELDALLTSGGEMGRAGLPRKKKPPLSRKSARAPSSARAAAVTGGGGPGAGERVLDSGERGAAAPTPQASPAAVAVDIIAGMEEEEVPRGSLPLLTSAPPSPAHPRAPHTSARSYITASPAPPAAPGARTLESSSSWQSFTGETEGNAIAVRVSAAEARTPHSPPSRRAAAAAAGEEAPFEGVSLQVKAQEESSTGAYASHSPMAMAAGRGAAGVGGWVLPATPLLQRPDHPETPYPPSGSPEAPVIAPLLMRRGRHEGLEVREEAATALLGAPPLFNSSSRAIAALPTSPVRPFQQPPHGAVDAGVSGDHGAALRLNSSLDSSFDGPEQLSPAAGGRSSAADAVGASSVAIEIHAGPGPPPATTPRMPRAFARSDGAAPAAPAATAITISPGALPPIPPVLLPLRSSGPSGSRTGSAPSSRGVLRRLAQLFRGDHMYAADDSDKSSSSGGGEGGLGGDPDAPSAAAAAAESGAGAPGGPYPLLPSESAGGSAAAGSLVLPSSLEAAKRRRASRMVQQQQHATTTKPGSASGGGSGGTPRGDGGSRSPFPDTPFPSPALLPGGGESAGAVAARQSLRRRSTGGDITSLQVAVGQGGGGGAYLAGESGPQAGGGHGSGSGAPPPLPVSPTRQGSRAPVASGGSGQGSSAGSAGGSGAPLAAAAAAAAAAEELMWAQDQEQPPWEGWIRRADGAPVGIVVPPWHASARWGRPAASAYYPSSPSAVREAALGSSPSPIPQAEEGVMGPGGEIYWQGDHGEGGGADSSGISASPGAAAVPGSAGTPLPSPPAPAAPEIQVTGTAAPVPGALAPGGAGGGSIPGGRFPWLGVFRYRREGSGASSASDASAAAAAAAAKGQATAAAPSTPVPTSAVSIGGHLMTRDLGRPGAPGPGGRGAYSSSAVPGLPLRGSEAVDAGTLPPPFGQQPPPEPHSTGSGAAGGRAALAAEGRAPAPRERQPLRISAPEATAAVTAADSSSSPAGTAGGTGGGGSRRSGGGPPRGGGLRGAVVLSNWYSPASTPVEQAPTPPDGGGAAVVAPALPALPLKGGSGSPAGTPSADSSPLLPGSLGAAARGLGRLPTPQSRYPFLPPQRNPSVIAAAGAEAEARPQQRPPRLPPGPSRRSTSEAVDFTTPTATVPLVPAPLRHLRRSLSEGRCTTRPGTPSGSQQRPPSSDDVTAPVPVAGGEGAAAPGGAARPPAASTPLARDANSHRARSGSAFVGSLTAGSLAGGSGLGGGAPYTVPSDAGAAHPAAPAPGSYLHSTAAPAPGSYLHSTAAPAFAFSEGGGSGDPGPIPSGNGWGAGEPGRSRAAPAPPPVLPPLHPGSSTAGSGGFGPQGAAATATPISGPPRIVHGLDVDGACGAVAAAARAPSPRFVDALGAVLDSYLPSHVLSQPGRPPPRLTHRAEPPSGPTAPRRTGPAGFMTPFSSASSKAALLPRGAPWGDPDPPRAPRARPRAVSFDLSSLPQPLRTACYDAFALWVIRMTVGPAAAGGGRSAHRAKARPPVAGPAAQGGSTGAPGRLHPYHQPTQRQQQHARHLTSPAASGAATAGGTGPGGHPRPPAPDPLGLQPSGAPTSGAGKGGAAGGSGPVGQPHRVSRRAMLMEWLGLRAAAPKMVPAGPSPPPPPPPGLQVHQQQPPPPLSGAPDGELQLRGSARFARRDSVLSTASSASASSAGSLAASSLDSFRVGGTGAAAGEGPSAGGGGPGTGGDTTDAHSVVSLDDLCPTDGEDGAPGQRVRARGLGGKGTPSSRYTRSLRPTPAQMSSLGLRQGANTLSFVVEEGAVSVSSTLYLWSPNTRIIVSDVDGTITKSDVLGHIFFYVGRDWTHAGVAQLYSNICANGYQVMYLTSRAIGQTDATKEYLLSIKQAAYSEADAAAAGGAGSGGQQKGTRTKGKGGGAHAVPADPRPGSPPGPAGFLPPGSPPARPAQLNLPPGAATLTLGGGAVLQTSGSGAPPTPLIPTATLATGSAAAAAAAAPPPLLRPSGVSAAAVAEATAPESGGPSAGTAPLPAPPAGAGAAAPAASHGAVIAAIAAGAAPVFQLPPGPVITSPDRLLTAFTREVIRRQPQEFKIRALSEIRELFPPGSSPFYAGFGNRDTDVLSYLAVGVPRSKIFVINHKGEISAVNATYRKSYPTLNAIVHEMFPPVSGGGAFAAAPHPGMVGPRFGRPVAVDERFNAVGYWRPRLPTLDPAEEAAALKDAADETGRKRKGAAVAAAAGAGGGATPAAGGAAAAAASVGISGRVSTPVATATVAAASGTPSARGAGGKGPAAPAAVVAASSSSPAVAPPTPSPPAAGVTAPDANPSNFNRVISSVASFIRPGGGRAPAVPAPPAVAAGAAPQAPIPAASPPAAGAGGSVSPAPTAGAPALSAPTGGGAAVEGGAAATLLAAPSSGSSHASSAPGARSGEDGGHEGAHTRIQSVSEAAGHPSSIAPSSPSGGAVAAGVLPAVVEGGRRSKKARRGKAYPPAQDVLSVPFTLPVAPDKATSASTEALPGDPHPASPPLRGHASTPVSRSSGGSVPPSPARLPGGSAGVGPSAELHPHPLPPPSHPLGPPLLDFTALQGRK